MAGNKKQTVDDRLLKVKEWALKSGYPLENDVEAILLGLQSKGERKFLRTLAYKATSEDGESKIRSIDFKCSFSYPTTNIPSRAYARGPHESSTLTFLIDAKFTKDEAWWFIPGTIGPTHFPYLIPRAVKDEFGDSDSIIANTHILEAAKCPTDWHSASSGKKVTEQGQASQRDSLTDYQVQMIQALTAVLQDKVTQIGLPSGPGRHYYRDIEIFIPIIVTNSVLYLTNAGISRQQIESAATEDQICTKRDVLYLDQPNLFHIQAALSSLGNTLKHMSKNNLAWLEQDLTRFPVIFSNVEKVESIMLDLIQKFERELRI